MVEMTEYAPGTPTWVDVTTPNMEATKAFYGGLFGWEAGPSDPEFGNYTNFALNGKLVCGFVPTMSPDQPAAWTTYVSTDDADAVTKAVRENGGQVAFEPMDVKALGRMAIFADPTGAHFGAWQPGQHKGAAIINEPGAMCWHHHLTRDMDAARAFYPAVFGWTTEADGEDTVWNLDGQPVAGAHAVGAEYPADAPPSWLVYFAVADSDATAAKAQELGGTLLMPVMDSEWGRTAVIADPHGAVFATVGMTR